MSESSKDSSREEEILRLAKERFQLAIEAERDGRELSLEDEKFRAGDQWPAEIKREREQDNRPCLVINRIPQIERQITNDQRQNRPAIKVYPVDDKADPETAKIFQGLFRHIEYNSNADVAYDTAFSGAVKKGFGFWRIVTDYVDPSSFDQEILIKRVKNDFSVHLDPSNQEPDGSDVNWGFIDDDILKDNYIAMYGESKLAKEGNWDAIGNTPPGWLTDKSCRVTEYFFKDFKTAELVRLVDGQTMLADELPEGTPPEMITARRKTQIPVIRWIKMNAIEILEEREWPGRWIPIVPVIGDELYIDGKRILEGIVRHAKDPQRMLNYWVSLETETIALAPRAPFIGAEGQFSGHERMWQMANRKALPFLQYKPVSLNGQLAPPPQRNMVEPPVMAITQARMGATEDLKATTGIYDASLGAQSNEKSGIAIQRRNIQAQTSNFHFVDNLSRALRHTGRIIIDLIPKIYDTARAARIIGEDGEQEIIRINEIFERNGKQVEYDLSAGKYDVIVEVGPSYATKRQEAAASMLQFIQAYPQAAPVVGDLFAKSMDWQGSTEIASRLKKMLPPGISDEEGDQKLPPEAQAQMQQMSQMIEQLTQKLNEADEEKRMKAAELESKERIEMAKLETQAAIEYAKLNSTEAVTLLEAQIRELDIRTKQLGMSAPIQDQFYEEQVPDQDMGLTEPQPTGEMPGPYMGV